MKYIVQVYEGEINGHGEKEGLPTEYQYEFEREMLKHIHELKNELREKGWTQRDLPPEVHQPSFLRGDESNAQLGFKFEWNLFIFTYTFTSTLHNLGVRWLASDDLVKKLN